MLWGLTLNPGEHFTYTFQDEVHVSLASLDCREPSSGSPHHVLIKTEFSEQVLCTLYRPYLFQQLLDVRLKSREQITFLVEGKYKVYLSGYTDKEPPTDDEEDDNDDADDEYEDEDDEHEKVDSSSNVIQSPKDREKSKEGKENNASSKTVGKAGKVKKKLEISFGRKMKSRAVSPVQEPMNLSRRPKPSVSYAEDSDSNERGSEEEWSPQEVNEVCLTRKPKIGRHKRRAKQITSKKKEEDLTNREAEEESKDSPVAPTIEDEKDPEPEKGHPKKQTEPEEAEKEAEKEPEKDENHNEERVQIKEAAEAVVDEEGWITTQSPPQVHAKEVTEEKNDVIEFVDLTLDDEGGEDGWILSDVSELLSGEENPPPPMEGDVLDALWTDYKITRQNTYVVGVEEKKDQNAQFTKMKRKTKTMHSKKFLPNNTKDANIIKKGEGQSTAAEEGVFTPSEDWSLPPFSLHLEDGQHEEKNISTGDTDQRGDNSDPQTFGAAESKPSDTQEADLSSSAMLRLNQLIKKMHDVTRQTMSSPQKGNNLENNSELGSATNTGKGCQHSDEDKQLGTPLKKSKQAKVNSKKVTPLKIVIGKVAGRSPRDRRSPRRFDDSDLKISAKNSQPDLVVNDWKNTSLGKPPKETVGGGGKIYHCDICSKSCRTEGYLRLHKMWHVKKEVVAKKRKSQSVARAKSVHIQKGLKPFKCSLCPRSLKNAYQLNIHFTRDHPGKEPPNPQQCNLCFRLFVGNGSLAKHMTCSHHKEERKNLLQCQYCSKIFAHKRYLQEHVKKNCKIIRSGNFQRNPKPSNSQDEKKVVKKKGLKEFTCSICSTNEKSAYQLSLHMKRNHPGTVPSASKNYLKYFRPFQCNYCKKMLTSGTTYRKHLKTHEKSNETKVRSPSFREQSNSPVRCEMCGRLLKNAANLKLHIEKFHEGQKVKLKEKSKDESTLKCPVCTKVFRNTEALILHMQKQHTGEKKTSLVKQNDSPFNRKVSCGICGKQFAGKKSLRSHEYKIHFQKEKVTGFVLKGKSCQRCKICRRVMSSASALKIHMTKMHPNHKSDSMNQLQCKSTSLKPGGRFECPVCHKKMVSINSLQIHMDRVHFVSDGEQVSPGRVRTLVVQNTSGDAASSSVVDNQEEEFQCGDCSEMFTSGDSLARHMQQDHMQQDHMQQDHMQIKHEAGSDEESAEIMPVQIMKQEPE